MENVLLHDGAPLKVRGFATLYGRMAKTADGPLSFRHGAFADSLRSGQDVVATWGHCLDFEWSSTRNGSLRLWETEVGLAFEGMIECSMRNRGLADYIGGGTAECSITYTVLNSVATATGCDAPSSRKSASITRRHSQPLVPSAAARARRLLAKSALTDEEIYGPAPDGLTMEQWLDFGRSCAHARRWAR